MFPPVSSSVEHSGSDWAGLSGALHGAEFSPKPQPPKSGGKSLQVAHPGEFKSILGF